MITRNLQEAARLRKECEAFYNKAGSTDDSYEKSVFYRHAEKCAAKVWLLLSEDDEGCHPAPEGWCDSIVRYFTER